MRHVPTDLEEFDDEIRGHLAISIQERIERGEDPESARLAALREFGNVTIARESVRDVWRPKWLHVAESMWQDTRIAMRSLARTKGLVATVVITLALGIGANAAVFSVLREVLLRPLVNREADRLIYIRQAAPGIGADNISFSVPEIRDLGAKVTTLTAIAEFSTIDFTMVGLGDPRVVKAGVVNGSYFEVMGLRPFLGRLLTEDDDRQDSESVAVLTHRFWATSLNGDKSVLGRTIQLGTKNTTIVGVLEPSVPYPTATELIANVVTSPHHLEATMVTKRTHRMTELFGRLAPGATVDSARSELTDLHQEIVRLHPDSYGTNADVQLKVRLFREELAAPARPILIVLLAAAVIVFVIACSNVANLILARAVRREGELTVRAALGASTGALRRTLLAESLVLCGGGAVLGILLARPLSWLIGRYAARFSVRALDVTIDASVLWIAAGLALLAAVALAYLPTLPSGHSSSGASPAAGSLRLTPGTNRRLNAFATVQIALSFVLLTGAAMLTAKLVALQSAETGYEMRHVLAIDVPLPFEAYGSTAVDFFQTVLRKVEALPAVERAAAGNFVPWRDAGNFGPGFQFAVEGGRARLPGDDEHAQLRNVTPGFFAAVGVPFIAGRDFTGDDRLGTELVVIVSRSVAERMFPDGRALDRRLWWTDPYFGKPAPRKIVGIVEDADDEHVVAEPTLLIYHPFRQMPYVNRLFVQTSGDPYGVVAEVRQLIHEVSGDQPVERPATLEDVRAEVLGPQRLNAFVGSAFAGVALVIAVVGVAGVLAFSVSARTREFGLLLAMGSTPARLMAGVLRDGGRIVSIGVAVGAVGGYAVGWLAAGYLGVALPPILPVLGAAAVVVAAAVVASLMPAARASHVDVVQALRSE